MSIENLGERIKAGFQVATGKAEAILTQNLNNLKRRVSQSESTSSHEARLKWMERPFFILQLRGNEKQSVLGRFINPEIHSAFCPAIKIDIKAGKLVGKKISVEFLISSDSLPKVISFPAAHMLKEGPNVIMPGIAIKTDRLQENEYTVSLAIPSGLILDSSTFPVKRLQNPLEEFNEVVEEGMTLQDVIDLAQDYQK